MLSTEREIGMNRSAGVEVQLCPLCQPMIDESQEHASRGFALYAVHNQLQCWIEYMGIKLQREQIKLDKKQPT